MTRRIAIAGAIWTGSILLSRVIGLVRDRVLGSTLGVDGTADVYAAAFRIPDFAHLVLATGTLSLVFIPIFAAHLEKGDTARAWSSFSNIANLLLGAAALVIPALWIALPWLAPLLAPGFSPDQLELLVRLTRIVLPAQAFILVSGLLTAALLAQDRHAVPALSPLLYNGGVIVGGLVGRSAEGFAWGVLAGSFAAHLVVPLWACLRVGLRWRPVLSLRDPDVATFARRVVPIAIGASILVWDDFLLTNLGSTLAAGQIATLNYGKTLMRVPMGVFGAAMAFAAYPTLTRLCLEGKSGEAYRTLTIATRRVLFLALGSQVVLTVAGVEAATVVYTTARIPPERLAELGVCVGLFCLALGAWSAQNVLSRGFYARGKTWLPTWLGTAVLLVTVPAYVWLARNHGMYGLAVASSLAVTLYTVLLEVILRRQIGEGPGYGPFLLRVVPATALGIAAGLFLRSLLGPPDWTVAGALGRGALLGGAGGLVYCGAAWIFGVQEVRETADALLRRLRRRR